MKFSLLYLLVFASVIVSCNKKDNSIPDPTTQFIDSARSWYNAKVLQADNVTLNWKNIESTAFPDGVRALEIPIQSDRKQGARFTKGSNASINAPDSSLFTYSSLIIYHSRANGFYYAVLKIIGAEEYKGQGEKKCTFMKLDNRFSGLILLEKWDGTFLKAARYKNGKRVNPLKAKEPGPMTESLICDMVTVNFYQQVCRGSWCGDATLLYSRTYYTNCTWIGDGGGQEGPIDYKEPPPDGGGGYTAPDVNLTDTINTDLLYNPCLAKNVREALDKGLSNAITRMVNETFGNSENFHLIFRESTGLADDDDATTIGTEAPMGGNWFDVIITFNANKLPYASQEYIAATIYHEVIHAYLSVTGRPGYFDHTAMAATYITKMENGLLELFPLLGSYILGNSNFGTHASALAWGGLQETTPWTLKKAAELAVANEINSLNNLHRRGLAGAPCPN